jgi:hypothetical protein
MSKESSSSQQAPATTAGRKTSYRRYGKYSPKRRHDRALTKALEKEVCEIYRAQVAPVPEIAHAYGVNATTVYRILLTYKVPYHHKRIPASESFTHSQESLRQMAGIGVDPGFAVPVEPQVEEVKPEAPKRKPRAKVVQPPPPKPKFWQRVMLLFK